MLLSSQLQKDQCMVIPANPPMVIAATTLYYDVCNSDGYIALSS